MIYLSIARILVLTVFFSVIAIQLRNYFRERLVLNLNLLAFAILFLGEALILGMAAANHYRPIFEYPIRPIFEIAALLFMSYLCNYEHNRLNRKHLKTITFYYALALLSPAGIYLLFSAEISRVVIFGLEIILFVKFLFNAADKIDESFEKKEIFLSGTALLLFVVDVFLRFFDQYISLGLTLAVTGFCIAFLSYTIRANMKLIDKEIETRDKEIRIFADITKKLNATFELSPLLNGFVVEICEILDAYSGALYLDKKSISSRAPEGELSDELVCEAIHGFYPPPQPVAERVTTKIEFLHKAIKTMPVKKGLRIVGRVFVNGTGELSKDLDKNDQFIQTIPGISMTTTMITMPLARQGRVYGVLQLVNRNDGENFTEEDFRFAEMIVDQASLAIHNAFLIEEREKKLETDADLKAAREIQLSLIPKTIPKNPMLDIGKFFSPTRQIGGDYYDFIEIDPTHLGVIIADVSGKGATGGLVMSVMRTLMRMISGNILSPKKVLMELNKGVEIAVKEKHMFITVLYCILDTERKVVTVCRAGHNPFLLCKGSTGKLEQYKPEGIALGIIDSETFSRITKEIEIPYETGDSMFLYTDGVTEEFNADRKMYGEERLKEHLERTVAMGSQQIVDDLVEDLKNFRGDLQDQHDDIAMINIKAL